MGKLLSKFRKRKKANLNKTPMTNSSKSSLMGYCRHVKTETNKLNNKITLEHFGYRITDTIGRGTYATVQRCYAEHLKREVAVKIIDRSKIPADVKEKFLPRELKITYNLKHANIVKCYNIMKAKNTIYMILELVEGDLLTFVVNEKFIEEKQAKYLTKGITSALQYLHHNNIAHRDLKLENILLDCNLVPKLSDFGFARQVQKHSLSRTYCGSAAYAPIEILSGTPYNPFLVDVWSLGVVIYAMTVGYLPFNDTKQIDKMKRGVQFNSAKQKLSNALKDLILKILVNDPTQRATVDSILHHHWLNIQEDKNTIKFCH